MCGGRRLHFLKDCGKISFKSTNTILHGLSVCLVVVVVVHVCSYAVVTPLRKVATYEPRIKDKLRKSKRITGH